MRHSERYICIYLQVQILTFLNSLCLITADKKRILRYLEAFAFGSNGFFLYL